MGFMDKAKKLAEQAQEKLDEVQTQFNQKQGSTGQPPEAPPAPEAPAAREAPTAPAPAPQPAASPDDVDRSHEKPPTLSSGDPLAG